jgi:hypothetical protein
MGSRAMWLRVTTTLAAMTVTAAAKSKRWRMSLRRRMGKYGAAALSKSIMAGRNPAPG